MGEDDGGGCGVGEFGGGWFVGGVERGGEVKVGGERGVWKGDVLCVGEGLGF